MIESLRETLLKLKPITMKCEFGFGTMLDLELSSDRPSIMKVYAGSNKELGYGPPSSVIIAPPSSGIISLINNSLSIGEESEEEFPI